MANFGSETVILRRALVLDSMRRAYVPKGEKEEKVFRRAAFYMSSDVTDNPAFYEVELNSDQDIKTFLDLRGTLADVVIEKHMFGPKFTKYIFLGTFAEFLKGMSPVESVPKKPEIKAAING